MACGITLKRTAHFDLLSEAGSSTLGNSTAIDYSQPCRQKRRRLISSSGAASPFESTAYDKPTHSMHNSLPYSKVESEVSSKSPFVLGSNKVCMSSGEAVVACETKVCCSKPVICGSD